MTSTLRSLKIRIGGVVESEPFAYTYEEQVILRFPPALAAELRQEIEEAGRPTDMSVTFTEARRATVMFHGRCLVGVLLDLPTIVETMKTTDRAQYCKVADISQMLLVLPEGPDTEVQLTEWEAKGWQYPDGLTPPLRDVRTHRFNKTSLSYGQPREVEKIERQVQALLAKDEAAVSSIYTVYDAAGRAVLRGGSSMDGKLVRLRPGEEDAEGEEDEEEEDAEDGEPIAAEEGDMVSGAVPDVDYSDTMPEEEGEEEDVDEFVAALEEEMMMADETRMTDETEELTQLTRGESQDPSTSHPSPTPSPAVLELRTRIEERKGQLASVTNPLIRARLEDVIRQLEQDLYARLNR